MNEIYHCTLLWRSAPPQGRIEVTHGGLSHLVTPNGDIQADNGFVFSPGLPARLEIALQGVALESGAFATRISVQTAEHSFTFFARDVSSTSPVWIPDYGVAIMPGRSDLSYPDVETEILAKDLKAQWQQIEAEPEESYEAACARNRDQVSPIWLGLSRDMRIFGLSRDRNLGYWGRVQPRYHSVLQTTPEGAEFCIDFAVGRGSSCEVNISSRLDGGVLPIVHSTQRDGDISYYMTAFATLETQPLSQENLRGTHHIAAYANSSFNMLTAEALEDYRANLEKPEMRDREEETICVVQLTATNNAAVPRYAFLKAAAATGHAGPIAQSLQQGLGVLENGEAFAINLFEGQAMPQSEMAVLLQPGQSATYLLLVPHQTLSRDRATALLEFDFDRHLQACRDFWTARLDSAAQIGLPEAAIDERLKAGLLHLDLATYALEPDGLAAATIGWYAPIGSESAPIIQFYDTMGWHQLARRSIEYFLDLQREDGFIQTYHNYQLETGPVLWTMGEHYRYTRDDAWVQQIKPKLLKSCEYLLAWRNRNKREDLQGLGYGLQDGKVADPDDFFHSFMLNALSYLGLVRAAEMLAQVDAAESKRLTEECACYREDIRRAYREATARSPVVPLGDGSWAPSFAPWTEYPGPVSLFAEGGNWFTHSAFNARDSLIGSLFLVTGEVFDADEPPVTQMLRVNQELFTHSNSGFSQPYYCRNDQIHAQRGEVKQFLKTYYNQFCAIQDRQTYNFWEHYYQVGEHKTHEEAWFLLQTRWMLFQERGDSLALLPLMPRDWLQDGQEIRFGNMVSYFGPISLHVQSQLERGIITARFSCESPRAPQKISIRLPHPQGLQPTEVSGGEYDAATETVNISSFKQSAEVMLRYH